MVIIKLFNLLLFLYITTDNGHVTFGKLKPFIAVYHAFPLSFFIVLHAFFVTYTFEFGIQPPVEPQDSKFKSIYK